MKRNVFEWIRDTMTDATSAIILTHNIDFLFLQSIVRPRLRKCGNPKLTVFADSGCATGSYRQQHFALDGLGRQYRVVPVELGRGRRFHPKAILLAGPSKAALAVGSGNVTHGGWSANHEIWATYESDDDGLPAISSFRNYLDTVLRLIPQSDSISEEVLSAFDAGANSWATVLPEPVGLYGTPSDRPLLDRIIGHAGDDIRHVTVCAPYYDPAGKALAELARRTTAPVRTLLQRGHVGLSASAASALPPNVQLISVDTEPARFIHAKLYGFYHSHSTMLVVGSANMSRVALMADQTWCNAELVAVQKISQERSDELLADLTILDESPSLPETAHSDEWEFPTKPVRILMARFVDGILEMAFKSDETIKDIAVEVDNRTRKQCSDHQDKGTARISLNSCPRSIRLHCTFHSGLTASSEPAWVDDEECLGISVTERRIVAKLFEASESGSLSASGLFEILQLLHQHLQQPTKRTAPSFVNYKARTLAKRSYSVEDIFSDDFGRLRNDPAIALTGGFHESDFFRTFEAYFTVTSAEKTSYEDELQTSRIDNQLVDGAEPKEIGNAKTKEEIERRHTERKRTEECTRFRKRLIRVLNSVASAMSCEAFFTGRTPQRLGADIAATALLLRKGLVDQIISEDDFALMSNRLWSVLFFGSKDEPSVIQKYLASYSTESSESVKAAIASPRLTAALTLWCFPDWDRKSTDAIQFRFRAMILAAELPWLVAGGTTDEIIGELHRLSRSLSKRVEYKPLFLAWKSWRQAGVAFEEFKNAASIWTPKDLAEMCNNDQVRSGKLLWQASEFWVADDCNYPTKVAVLPLKGGTPRKFARSWLVPVLDLLMDPNLLRIHEGARRLLHSILSEVEGV